MRSLAFAPDELVQAIVVAFVTVEPAVAPATTVAFSVIVAVPPAASELSTRFKFPVVEVFDVTPAPLTTMPLPSVVLFSTTSVSSRSVTLMSYAVALLPAAFVIVIV